MLVQFYYIIVKSYTQGGSEIHMCNQAKTSLNYKKILNENSKNNDLSTYIKFQKSEFEKNHHYMKKWVS